jgi:hypothetical protein
MCPRLTDDPFDKLESEARQSISVGNHNRFDMTALDSLQKPRETSAFVVEAGCDVAEDGVAWESALHFRLLALEVVFLLLA